MYLKINSCVVSVSTKIKMLQIKAAKKHEFHIPHGAGSNSNSPLSSTCAPIDEFNTMRKHHFPMLFLWRCAVSSDVYCELYLRRTVFPIIVIYPFGFAVSFGIVSTTTTATPATKLAFYQWQHTIFGYNV